MKAILLLFLWVWLVDWGLPTHWIHNRGLVEGDQNTSLGLVIANSSPFKSFSTDLKQVEIFVETAVQSFSTGLKRVAFLNKKAYNSSSKSMLNTAVPMLPQEKGHQKLVSVSSSKKAQQVSRAKRKPASVSSSKKAQQASRAKRKPVSVSSSTKAQQALRAKRKPARFEGHSIKTLRLKDYEQMRDLLYVYIKDSRSILPEDSLGGGDIAVMELKNGLKALFMRPNTDSLLRSLIPIIQNEIIKYRSFMSVLRELVRESMQELKAKKGSIAYQAGLFYLLENSLAYTQSINNPSSQVLLKEVKTADIKVSRKLSNWLTLEMGRGRVKSPSRLAGDILQQRRKRAKQKTRRQKTRAGLKTPNQRHPAGESPPHSEDTSKKIIHLR